MQAAKEAKIENQAFEEIFGKDRESYEKILSSPKCKDNTPCPSPVHMENEDSNPSPEIEEEEEKPLIINEDTIVLTEAQKVKINRKIRKQKF